MSSRLSGLQGEYRSPFNYPLLLCHWWQRELQAGTNSDAAANHAERPGHSPDAVLQLRRMSSLAGPV